MVQNIHLLEYMQSGRLEAGCDEAGRGPLAGPVFAAAVILPEGFHHPLLNDSKKMSAASRELLRPIIEREAIAWAIVAVEAEEIDRINILNASITGMQRAVGRLGVRPDFLLIDGNRFRPFEDIPYQTVVHGDATYSSIAAASVLAKTWRDEAMMRLHEQYPMYHWDENKGYPTRKHREAISRYGTTPYHRMSFNLLGGTGELNLDFKE